MLMYIGSFDFLANSYDWYSTEVGTRVWMTTDTGAAVNVPVSCRQYDGISCGLFVCMFAASIVLNPLSCIPIHFGTIENDSKNVTLART
jgi:hypothetical protein